MSIKCSERRERYEHAVSQSLAWLANQQESDSSFGLDVNEGVNPIFVIPMTYLWGGMPSRCFGIIERIRSLYIQQDGTLYRPAASKIITDRMQVPYALGWVIRATAACGAQDVPRILADRLAYFQHKDSGGLFGTQEHADHAKGIIDLASTGMGGLGFLATGQLDRACAAGDYLAKWLTRQDDSQTRLLCQWHTEQGLLNEEASSEQPVNPNAPLIIGHNKPYTGYWLSGILLAFLAELYMITGRQSYLNTASQVFDFTEASPELGNVCAAHKFAWGAARLFVAKNDRRYIEAACRVADRLVQAQHPEGYFVHEDFCSIDDEIPQRPKVSVTSQFGAWISAAAMYMPLQ